MPDVASAGPPLIVCAGYKHVACHLGLKKTPVKRSIRVGECRLYSSRPFFFFSRIYIYIYIYIYLYPRYRLPVICKSSHNANCPITRISCGLCAARISQRCAEFQGRVVVNNYTQKSQPGETATQ